MQIAALVIKCSKSSCKNNVLQKIRRIGTVFALSGVDPHLRERQRCHVTSRKTPLLVRCQS